jgi:hypothetical protein
MNETDLSDYVSPIDDDFRKLLWDQLTIEERIVMKAYSNNLANDKTIHVKLHSAVQTIMERYPDFDITCVP